jgi:DNA-binding GntR family transcriptional regulator
MLYRPETGVGSYRALDSRFHIGIAEASGNAPLTKLIAELCVEFSTWTRLSGIDREFTATHKPIYDSLMTRDADRARAEVREHLICARDTCLELVE